jgi:hypothetical protein
MLAASQHGHRLPVLLADGRHFLFAAVPAKAARFDVFSASLHGPSPAFVASFDNAPVQADAGWLLYSRQGRPPRGNDAAIRPHVSLLTMHQRTAALMPSMRVPKATYLRDSPGGQTAYEGHDRAANQLGDWPHGSAAHWRGLDEFKPEQDRE